METKIDYRLECNHHFWNFETEKEAETAAKELHLCAQGFVIKEVTLILDEIGNVLSRDERKIQ